MAFSGAQHITARNDSELPSHFDEAAHDDDWSQGCVSIPAQGGVTSVGFAGAGLLPHANVDVPTTDAVQHVYSNETFVPSVVTVRHLTFKNVSEIVSPQGGWRQEGGWCPCG